MGAPRGQSLVKKTAPRSTRTTIDGLANGTTYVFQVRAVKKAGKSRWSKRSTSVAPAPVQVQQPAPTPDAGRHPDQRGRTSDPNCGRAPSAPARPNTDPDGEDRVPDADTHLDPDPVPPANHLADRHRQAHPHPNTDGQQVRHPLADTDAHTHAVDQPPPTPAGAWWAPAKGTSWQWQLTGTIDTTVDAAVFDIDGEDASAATVSTLHAKGAKVICYFSAGSWENWRSDAATFPASVQGKGLDGWAGESWLDVRQLGILLPLMEKRVANCKAKGFDAVEPDNVDGYSNATGFPLTAADQIAYNKGLADLAHKYGLGIALKNDPDQVTALEPFFDFSVAEECAKYNECDGYAPFTTAGKAVLHVEYQGALTSFCPTTKALGFSSMLKKLDLDAWRSPCP